jgi:hypothetical protein
MRFTREYLGRTYLGMAEEEGFEPPRPFRA